ncbi:MAG: peptide chain release factor N(5)-glutamine methyltransferase [Flavobacteriales bacterium]
MRTPDNRVVSVLEQYQAQLADRYSAGEVKAIVRTVFHERLGWDVSQMEIRKFGSLSESELLKVYLPLKRLRAGEPMQYVLGEVDFHGLRIGVGPGVLIPRPETEEMVDHIVRYDPGPSRVLDIGTGSGCIGLAVKRAFPNATVLATDVSPVALEIARRNGALNDLEVEWVLHDILKEDPTSLGRFDLVVSNPPYVPRAEEMGLSEQVRDHEPHLALFVEDEDPLLFYRVIATKAKDVLVEGGHLWFEGHWFHAAGVGALLAELRYTSVEVLNDLSGNQRFIHARR